MSQSLKQITDILLAALTVEVAKDSSIDTVTITKQPGDSIGVDTDCDAMVWLRVVDSFPSVGGATYDLQPGVTCTYSYTHRIEVGIVRKSPLPNEVFGIVDLPDDETITESADHQYDDFDTLKRAINRATKNLELTPESYAPMGPVQGVIGGTWAVLVSED